MYFPNERPISHKIHPTVRSNYPKPSESAGVVSEEPIDRISAWTENIHIPEQAVWMPVKEVDVQAWHRRADGSHYQYLTTIQVGGHYMHMPPSKRLLATGVSPRALFPAEIEAKIAAGEAAKRALRRLALAPSKCESSTDVTEQSSAGNLELGTSTSTSSIHQDAVPSSIPRMWELPSETLAYEILERYTYVAKKLALSSEATSAWKTIPVFRRKDTAVETYRLCLQKRKQTIERWLKNEKPQCRLIVWTQLRRANIASIHISNGGKNSIIPAGHVATIFRKTSTGAEAVAHLPAALREEIPSPKMSHIEETRMIVARSLRGLVKPSALPQPEELPVHKITQYLAARSFLESFLPPLWDQSTRFVGKDALGLVIDDFVNETKNFGGEYSIENTCKSLLAIHEALKVGKASTSDVQKNVLFSRGETKLSYADWFKDTAERMRLASANASPDPQIAA